MEAKDVESLLMMFTVIFVVLIVMLTVNEFGANAMTLVLSAILLSGLLEKHYLSATDNSPIGVKDVDPGFGIGSNGGLIGMSFFDLDSYYDSVKAKMQFPGWRNTSTATGHVSDLLVRLVITIVLIAYFVKSGIFKMSNLNPFKRLM